MPLQCQVLSCRRVNLHSASSANQQLLTQKLLRVAMIGGGYISCEQASIYNNFGAEVHLLVRSVRLSPLQRPRGWCVAA